MKANVLAPFHGVPDGDSQTCSFKRGDTIHGDLAAAMVDAGYAEEIGGEKKAEAAAPKNKARAKARAKAPRNKRR
jgi:hypothetical protein